jgi:hypothetical protein
MCIIKQQQEMADNEIDFDALANSIMNKQTSDITKNEVTKDDDALPRVIKSVVNNVLDEKVNETTEKEEDDDEEIRQLEEMIKQTNIEEEKRVRVKEQQKNNARTEQANKRKKELKALVFRQNTKDFGYLLQGPMHVRRITDGNSRGCFLVSNASSSERDEFVASWDGNMLSMHPWNDGTKVETLSANQILHKDQFKTLTSFGTNNMKGKSHAQRLVLSRPEAISRELKRNQTVPITENVRKRIKVPETYTFVTHRDRIRQERSTLKQNRIDEIRKKRTTERRSFGGYPGGRVLNNPKKRDVLPQGVIERTEIRDGKEVKVKRIAPTKIGMR